MSSAPSATATEAKGIPCSMPLLTECMDMYEGLLKGAESCIEALQAKILRLEKEKVAPPVAGAIKPSTDSWSTEEVIQALKQFRMKSLDAKSGENDARGGVKTLRESGREDPERRKHPKPRGRPPKGKQWNYFTGIWEDIEEEDIKLCERLQGGPGDGKMVVVQQQQQQPQQQSQALALYNPQNLTEVQQNVVKKANTGQMTIANLKDAMEKNNWHIQAVTQVMANIDILQVCQHRGKINTALARKAVENKVMNVNQANMQRHQVQLDMLIRAESVYDETVKSFVETSKKQLVHLQQQLQQGNLLPETHRFQHQGIMERVRFMKSVVGRKTEQLQEQKKLVEKQIQIIKEHLDKQNRGQFASKYQHLVKQQHGDSRWYRSTVVVNITVPPNLISKGLKKTTIYFKPRQRQNFWDVVKDENEMLHRKNFSGERFPPLKTTTDIAKDIEAELNEI